MEVKFPLNTIVISLTSVIRVRSQSPRTQKQLPSAGNRQDALCRLDSGINHWNSVSNSIDPLFESKSIICGFPTDRKSNMQSIKALPSLLTNDYVSHSHIFCLNNIQL